MGSGKGFAFGTSLVLLYFCPTYTSYGSTMYFKAGYLGSFFLEENKSPDLSNRKVLITFCNTSPESFKDV